MADRRLLVIYEDGGDLSWDLCKDWSEFRADVKKYCSPDFCRADIFCAFWVIEEADDLDFYKGE